MNKFTTIDDIERKKEEQAREEFKKKVSGDIKDIFEDIFPSKKPKKKKKKNWFFRFLKLIGILSLLLLVINFILGNLWLFKTLIRELFLGG